MRIRCIRGYDRPPIKAQPGEEFVVDRGVAIALVATGYFEYVRANESTGSRLIQKG